MTMHTSQPLPTRSSKTHQQQLTIPPKGLPKASTSGQYIDRYIDIDTHICGVGFAGVGGILAGSAAFPSSFFWRSAFMLRICCWTSLLLYLLNSDFCGLRRPAGCCRFQMLYTLFCQWVKMMMS